MKNGSSKVQDIQPMMILTIDIGNGHVDKLQLFDLNNIEQETYDFCVKNKLDFNTMHEINTQIQNVLKDKQLEEEQELDNVFQEIKEEEDEKITENNLNEIREQESIIITNSNEIETQKGNKNDIIKENNNNKNENNKIEKDEKDNNNKKENENNKLDNENMNSINSNNNNQNIKKNNNQSIRTNNSNLSYDSKKIKKQNKSKKKNIKDNIKEAIAMAKEKTKQTKKIINKDDNKQFYKNKNKDKEVEINNIIQKDEEYNKEIVNNNNNFIELNNNEINNKENENKNKMIEEEEKKNDFINNIESKNKTIKKEENSPNENDDNTEKIKEIEKGNINKKLSNNININNDNDYNNNSKENQTNKKRNKSISNNVSHISNYNPGKELYERGIKFKENEKEKLEALKKNLEVDEEEDNTFTPKINRLSEIQKERIKEKRLECTNPEIINNYQQYKKEKMEILKQKTDEEFNKVCTFKPCINRSYSTTKILKNNSNKERETDNNKINIKNESRFDKLYNYRLDYKENKDKLKQKIYGEYSFKPKINENSSFYKLNIPFNERLQTYSNKSKENMAKIQQVYERELGYDESFKPQLNSKKNKTLLKDRDEFFLNEAQKYNNMNSGNNINNTNNNNNNNNYIDPYTKLYLYGKKYQQEKNFLAEKYYQNQNKPPKFCESTEEIINRKKEKSFRQIFKILDGDEDSKISSTHINISKLPKNILKILQPIFNELKEENETLNEIEFVFVCEQLYLSLPWNDKRELTTFEDIAKKNLKKEKIIKEKNNFSFKPKINKRNYSFDNPTIINNNNELNIINYNKDKDILNKNQYSFINNYYINKKKNNNNEKKKENKKKNNKNQINNRVNYFNVKVTNQNNIEIKNNNNEYSYINYKNTNNNNDKYSILKNININIIGNKKKNDDKNSYIVEKKINYENFVNVKNSS